MPLSEHEQRQLEQIEQSLYADHPRLARAMRAKDPKVHYRRRLVESCAGFVVGVGAVVAGVLLKHPWLDVVGFVIMVASSVWAITNYRRMAGVTLERQPRGGRSRDRDRKQARPTQTNTGVMDRLEERWRRRQERDR